LRKKQPVRRAREVQLLRHRNEAAQQSRMEVAQIPEWLFANLQSPAFGVARRS
jgi:hypothetical protein